MSVATELDQHAVRTDRIRPKKPRSPRLYAYVGGGVDYQPEEVSAIVVRTGDPVLLAAVVAAARLAMATWPSGGHLPTFDLELVEGERPERESVLLAMQMYAEPP